MIDEGIYLFFANELSTPQDVLNPFSVVNFSKEFLEDIRTHFMRFDLDASDDDEPHAELKAVTKQKFNEYCGRTRTVLFVCTKSLIEFEFALRESAKAVDVFRDTISNNGF